MWLPKLKGGETDLENPDLKYLGRNLSQTLHPTNYGWGEGGGRSYKFLETRVPWLGVWGTKRNFLGPFGAPNGPQTPKKWCFLVLAAILGETPADQI